MNSARSADRSARYSSSAVSRLSRRRKKVLSVSRGLSVRTGRISEVVVGAVTASPVWPVAISWAVTGDRTNTSATVAIIRTCNGDLTGRKDLSPKVLLPSMARRRKLMIRSSDLAFSSQSIMQTSRSGMPGIPGFNLPRIPNRVFKHDSNRESCIFSKAG